MIEVLAPAKLTLGLRVVGVRDDGMHLIEAEMVTLDLADRLTITEGTGIEVVGDDQLAGLDPADNLVARALQLCDRQAHVRIEKRIPAGAGLGGGSADAAAVLRWAGFSDPIRAAAIGADIAFCLRGGRAMVSGIGEIVEPEPFVPRTFTLLTPPLHCSTPAVYAAWDELADAGGAQGEAALVGNDLLSAALVVEPRLAEYRDLLAEVSDQVPRLAGSGSTWFVEGEFPGEGRVVASTTPSSYGDPQQTAS